MAQSLWERSAYSRSGLNEETLILSTLMLADSQAKALELRLEEIAAIMRRVTQGALVSVLMLAVTSVATAQGTMQVPSGAAVPAVRFGNFIEVGNDVLMHIIASGDLRYQTTTNFDFERKVRDRVASRNPTDSGALLRCDCLTVSSPSPAGEGEAGIRHRARAKERRCMSNIPLPCLQLYVHR
jgi:hypothetical protein